MAAYNRSMAAEERQPGFQRIRLVLGRSSHFRSLPGEILDRLARLGSVARFKGGTLIHPAWQPSNKVWLVLKGGMRVALANDGGGVTTVAVLGEGSYYSAGSLVKGKSVPSDAVAIGRTELAAFETSRVHQEFAGDDAMEQFVRQLIVRRLEATIDLLRDAVAVPLSQRLARRLLAQALSAGHGRDGIEVELRLAQADLAEMLGASRSKVNAELRRLERSGALRLGYRNVVVRDMAGLCAAAGAAVIPV